MYRKAYQRASEWKHKIDRKPLLLLARQVGKTWLMKEFEPRVQCGIYQSTAMQTLAKELFQNDYDIRRFLLGFQAISYRQ